MQTNEAVLGPATELPRAFARSASDHLAVLKEALLFDDEPRVQMAARSLKRMCGAVASGRMRALAAQLEDCRAGDLRTAVGLIREMEQELAVVRHTRAA